MESGTSSDSQNKHKTQRNQSRATALGSMMPKIGPFVPRTDHNPNELKSWAKRTGFVSNFSGETTTSVSEKFDHTGLDVERGDDHSRGGGSSPKIEIDPILGRTRPNRWSEIEPDNGFGRGERRNGSNGGGIGFREGYLRGENNERRRVRDEPRTEGRMDERLNADRNGISHANEDGNGNKVLVNNLVEEKKEEDKYDRDFQIDMYPGGEGTNNGGWPPAQSEMKCGLRENPGYVPLLYYGLQHFLSLAGSLIFIPLIMVPAMGGTDKDTATVISTVLLVSGITTILNSYFGTRLPLVQGSSFVYLAPALVIINAKEYRNLTEHKFRHIMRELQGAIIVGSIFQSLLGFGGLMSLLLRLINPVVVAPTVAAVGLAFISYGFPQAGSCIEISIPMIILVIIFTLYLRGISVFGHHLFRIYAVPLSVMIIWTYAFFLTAGGVYNFKGCSPNIPSSNILSDACVKHAYTMKHCRTDVSNAWRTAEWVRIPYPLQWGVPIFHIHTSLIMVIVSLVASVNSVGTYHTASIVVNSKPPTPGIVSRGIALEGFCSILAGLWGTGTGSTTLTENVHTLNVTKMASRRAVEIGAVLLIIFSFVGKVGAILASVPLALTASVLCFMWALVVVMGLSTLQYTQAASFRNITIVGVSLFLGLSIPAYFQQYQPETILILPSYFIPYSAASNGPVNSGSKQFDFAMNALLSMNMVVTLLVAFVLDNTVPGSRQERGVYIWSRAEDLEVDPSLQADYSLPRRCTRLFCCAR